MPFDLRILAGPFFVPAPAKVGKVVAPPGGHGPTSTEHILVPPEVRWVGALGCFVFRWGHSPWCPSSGSGVLARPFPPVCRDDLRVTWARTKNGILSFSLSLSVSLQNHPDCKLQGGGDTYSLEVAISCCTCKSSSGNP